MIQKTCFVITGFGKKTDYATGRVLDLDKTYEYIIAPVFEELGFLCYRASDIKHSGVIDIPMYENILKADFVIADLSTLNPNVLYELGIRHAVRKNTTIIIAEKELKYPFDLSHILIEPYEHLGTAIDYGEVKRFRGLLKEKISKLLSIPTTDSPLYTLFPALEVPRFTEKEVETIKENIAEEGSLSDLLTAAESKIKELNYEGAKQILEKAKALHQDNTLVVQRLALVTYKSKKPSLINSLLAALEILKELNPEISTDLETLGLSGAIYKRLFEASDNSEYLYRAVWYYEKGFYLGEDYYNGVNLAYLFTQQAVLEEDKFEAYAAYGNAQRVRRKVMQICETLMTGKIWDNREDKAWIYLTLAECHYGLGAQAKEKEFVEKAKTVVEGSFEIDSYQTQRSKLEEHITAFHKKFES